MIFAQFLPNFRVLPGVCDPDAARSVARVPPPLHELQEHIHTRAHRGRQTQEEHEGEENEAINENVPKETQVLCARNDTRPLLAVSEATTRFI
jgi:hypothetical protein